MVVLHYYNGFSAAEIARILQIPEGTARSRLHYAIGAMRAALEADARPSGGRQGRSGVMTTDDQFDDTIIQWFEDAAPARMPDRVLDATFERTRKGRQDVDWRAAAADVAAIRGRAGWRCRRPAWGSRWQCSRWP